MKSSIRFVSQRYALFHNLQVFSLIFYFNKGKEFGCELQVTSDEREVVVSYELLVISGDAACRVSACFLRKRRFSYELRVGKLL